MNAFLDQLFYYSVLVGVVGVIIGEILHFGISKAELYGKVSTDPKTAKRIKIGYYCISLIVILPVLAVIIANIIE